MRRWQKHTLFWIGVYFMWMYMKNYEICFDLAGMLINMVQVLSYMAIYYAVREVFIPKFFDQGRWLSFGSAVVLWTILVVSIWNGLMGVLAYFFQLPPLTIPDSYGAYILEGVQMYVPGMILLAWESFQDAQDEEERLQILEKEKISSELNYLKSKVNPQFIFNTLKNLKLFVDAKSDKAPDMILRFSEVLDYVLYRSQNSSVNLKKEISIINGFLTLEKLRYGDKLDVFLKTEGDHGVAISPGTLLSFVEHSLREDFINKSNDLVVEIFINASFDIIECIMDIKSKNGHDLLTNGYVEFRRQLILTYPDRHSFSIDEDIGTTITKLILKIGS